MTNPDAQSAHSTASDSPMDQALDWLIRLECASTEQQLQFNDWLNQDPAHRQAFLKARSIWDSPAVHHVARQIAGL